jgi:hypothetical protein
LNLVIFLNLQAFSLLRFLFYLKDFFDFQTRSWTYLRVIIIFCQILLLYPTIRTFIRWMSWAYNQLILIINILILLLSFQLIFIRRSLAFIMMKTFLIRIVDCSFILFRNRILIFWYLMKLIIIVFSSVSCVFNTCLQIWRC